MSCFPRAFQKGYTLMEMILVLTIISAILIGAFLLYPRVQASAQAKEEATLVKSIAAEVRRLYPTGNYGPLTSGDLLGGNALPEDLQTPPTDTANSATGNVLSNRWGAAIEVYPSQADGTPVAPSPTGNAPFFAVRYWGANDMLCRAMVAQLLNSAAAVLVDDGPVNADRRVVKNAYVDADLDPSQTAVGCRDANGIRPRVIVVSD